ERIGDALHDERGCGVAIRAFALARRERARNERNTAAGAILAGVEALRLKRVRNIRTLDLVPASVRAERSDDVHVVLLSPACVSAPAAALSASCKAGGNARPLFAARRRIPSQARALKKYRCGTLPSSSTSDNEHATAS